MNVPVPLSAWKWMRGAGKFFKITDVKVPLVINLARVLMADCSFTYIA